MRRRCAIAITAALLALGLAPATVDASATTSGAVTLRTLPVVVGATFELDGVLGRTDSSGAATFRTNDLDGARAGVRLVGGDIGPTTRIKLLHVAADPNHAIGARVLLAELAVSRPVDLRFVDRRGDPIPASAITGVTVRSSDEHAMTVQPADGAVWLPSATAVRGVRPPGREEQLSYAIAGVRVQHVPVALGHVIELGPTGTAWDVPLAGYPFNVKVRTVPAVADVALSLDDETVTTDAEGSASFYTTSLDRVPQRVRLESEDAAPGIRVTLGHVANDGKHALGTRKVVVGLGVKAAVKFAFVDVRGKDVRSGRIASVTLGGPHGQRVSLPAGSLRHKVWLPASRLSTTTPPQAHPVSYTVDAVSTYGTNAVFAGGQHFDPITQPTWVVRLHLYQLDVTAHDMLLGQASHGAVTLTAPDGSELKTRLRHGMAAFSQVPRGEYQLAVASGARHMNLPVRVARTQVVDVRVISWADVALVGIVALGLAIAVVWLGARARRRRVERAAVAAALASTPTRIGVLVLVAGLLGAMLSATSARPAAAATACQPPSISTKVAAEARPTGFPMPVWGYYYIWYTPTSWHRAKIDTPDMGCYSSDDPAVMRAHIRMAKAAGLTGFLVSWKHTRDLDRRLRQLTEIAAQERFDLGIVYEALDFYRQPLPPRTIRRDLQWFTQHYGHNRVFTLQGKPVVVWTGTESYPTPVVAAVAGGVRQHLTLLASAKSPEDYTRVAKYVDGDAYYWSSGDPAAPSYARKLGMMGSTVHAHRGIWLAPAAPGFNARALGGHRNIKRDDGTTLRLSLAAALASAPDAIGIISWNEWSENTYVEPSHRYGTTDLAVLADTFHGRLPKTVPVDSSDDVIGSGGWRGWHALLVLIGISAATIVAVEQRRRRALHREVTKALRSEFQLMAGTSRPTRGRGDEGQQR